MAQANDSYIANPDASGATMATHVVGGKEYPVLMEADSSGHLVQTLPSYLFFIKGQAGAAGRDHFEIWNGAGSGKILEMRGIWLMPSLLATVVGTVSPDFDFYRTSAIGTGGTVVNYKQTTFPNISPLDTDNAAIPAQITMRLIPTGGATIAEALFTSYITQEEGSTAGHPGAQIAQWYNILPETAFGQRYTIQEGQGFKLRQITLGVAQNFSFFGFFTLE